MNYTHWKSVSELQPIDVDISNFGYKAEYIESLVPDDIKNSCRADVATLDDIFSDCPFFITKNPLSAVINLSDPLEVKAVNGSVYYRENDDLIDRKPPEFFETQFGTFNNHNNGEFISWLGKDGYDGLSEKEKKFHHFFKRDDYFIDGKFCDMFDCGEYSYAISNSMHLGIGSFKIVRIDKKLEAITLYENSKEPYSIALEYMGYFTNSNGYIIITSGSFKYKTKDDAQRYQDTAILFQIDSDGGCTKFRKWNFRISKFYSMCVDNDFIYFGQNKMITRLNIQTGEVAYFTNKSDKELTALTRL